MIIEGKIFPYKKKMQKLFEVAGQHLKEDFSNVCVSVNFVDEKEIQNLNNNFRKIDKVTDVLSFPNIEKSPEQKLSNFSDFVVDAQLFLGDIVICKSIAKNQAKEYGHSLKREVCFLALHSLLHLLGYDHIEKEDEIIMQKKTKEILESYGVLR